MGLRLLNVDLSPVDTSVNGWFGAGVIGQGTDYRAAIIYNANGDMSFTSGRLSVRPDPGGGGFAIAVLDGTARFSTYNYGSVDPSAGSYSSPTDAATGLVLPTLGANQQVLIGVRRALATGTVALPEANVLRVDGEVPVGYI